MTNDEILYITSPEFVKEMKKVKIEEKVKNLCIKFKHTRLNSAAFHRIVKFFGLTKPRGQARIKN